LPKGDLILVTGFNNKEKSTTVGRQEWIDDPSSFRPHVWLDERGHFDEKLLQKFSFFGEGAHKCPGRQLGFDLVTSIVAATLSHFTEIEFADGIDESKTAEESLTQFRQKMAFVAKSR